MKGRNKILRKFGIARLKKASTKSHIRVSRDIVESLDVNDANGWISEANIINSCLADGGGVRKAGDYIFDMTKYPIFKMLGVIGDNGGAMLVDTICVELSRGILTPIYTRTRPLSTPESHAPFMTHFSGYFISSGMAEAYCFMRGLEESHPATGNSILHTSLADITYCQDRAIPWKDIGVLGGVCPDVPAVDMAVDLREAMMMSDMYQGGGHDTFDTKFFIDRVQQSLYPGFGNDFAQVMTGALCRTNRTNNLNIRQKVRPVIEQLVEIDDPNAILTIDSPKVFDLVSYVFNFHLDDFHLSVVFDDSGILDIHKYGSSSGPFMDTSDEKFIKSSFAELVTNILDDLHVNGMCFIKKRGIPYYASMSGKKKFRVHSIDIIRNPSEDMVIRIVTKEDGFEIYLDLIAITMLSPKMYYDVETD